MAASVRRGPGFAESNDRFVNTSEMCATRYVQGKSVARIIPQRTHHACPYVCLLVVAPKNRHPSFVPGDFPLKAMDKLKAEMPVATSAIRHGFIQAQQVSAKPHHFCARSTPG